MTDTATELGAVGSRRGGGMRRLSVMLSLLLVLVAAGTALFVVRGVDGQLDDVGRTHELRRHLQQLMLALTEAETGQRGYLLTLDPAYLDPYQRALGQIGTEHDAVVALLAGDPQRQARIEEIGLVIDQKRAEMASTVSSASAGRLGDALTILRSDAGRSLMERIEETIRSFIAEEDAQLAERNAEVRTYRSWLVVAILAALAGSATLAYALFNRAQQQMSELARTRSTLLAQNEELEERVRRRTADVEEARARAERERARVETLLRETNHRIGNSLATVSSLLNLQLQRSQSDEVRSALEAAQSRVQAIASGHRRLRLGPDLETTAAHEFLGAVLADLETSHNLEGRVTFVTHFDPLVINARDATTVGILLGELVTNALKHAFAERSGTIWTRFGRDEGGTIALTVEDDGPGFGTGTSGRGLGAMIIRQLAMQYGGEVIQGTREGGGSRVVVTLPGLDHQHPDGATPNDSV